MAWQTPIRKGKSRIKQQKNHGHFLLNWLVIDSSITSPRLCPTRICPFPEGSSPCSNLEQIYGVLPAPELPVGLSERFVAISSQVNFSLCPVSLHSLLTGVDLEYTLPYSSCMQTSKSIPRELILMLNLLRAMGYYFPQSVMRGAEISVLNILKGSIDSLGPWILIKHSSLFEARIKEWHRPTRRTIYFSSSFPVGYSHTLLPVKEGGPRRACN